MATQPAQGLLGPAEPAPVIALNTDSRSPFLLIGDHAGIVIPARLDNLGVAAADLQRHIACDIGVRGLGEMLSRQLDAPFLHQPYSRLVIDCNRDPASAAAIPESSDGTSIPGNIGLSDADRADRISAIHAPYQDAIAAEIGARTSRGQPVILVSLHSFTPMLADRRTAGERPWHIGILHAGGKEAFTERVLDRLRRDPTIIVGDNEPYRMDATDHTVPRHAFASGLDYVEIEVRQDLIADAAGQQDWSGRLSSALRGAQL